MFQLTSNQEELAKLIKETRKIEGITQAEIAERLGVPHSQYQLFESAKKDSQISTVFRVLDAMGLEMVITTKGEKLNSADPATMVNQLEYEDRHALASQLIPSILNSENHEYVFKVSKSKQWHLPRVLNDILNKIRTSITLDEFRNCVEPTSGQSIFRFKSGSTSADVHRLCTLIESGTIEEITFGVKHSQNNGRELVGFAKIKGFTILFDNMFVNHARDARIFEVKTLIKSIVGSKLTCPVSLIMEPVENTRLLPVEEAWLIYQNCQTTAFNVELFLPLIAPGQTFNLLEYQPDSEFEITIEKIRPVFGSTLVYVKACESREQASLLFDTMTLSNIEPEGEYIVSLKVNGTQVNSARVNNFIFHKS